MRTKTTFPRASERGGLGPVYARDKMIRLGIDSPAGSEPNLRCFCFFCRCELLIRAKAESCYTADMEVRTDKQKEKMKSGCDTQHDK